MARAIRRAFRAIDEEVIGQVLATPALLASLSSTVDPGLIALQSMMPRSHAQCTNSLRFVLAVCIRGSVERLRMVLTLWMSLHRQACYLCLHVLHSSLGPPGDADRPVCQYLLQQTACCTWVKPCSHHQQDDGGCPLGKGGTYLQAVAGLHGSRSRQLVHAAPAPVKTETQAGD